MNRIDILSSSSSSSSSSEEEEEIYLRRRKLYRRRKTRIDEYDDVDFFDRFRLTKPTALSLLEAIAHLITMPTNRGGSISPMVQLLLTLRFYATGSFLIAIGDFMGVSKSSASRIVKRVSKAIVTLRGHYIKMYDTEDEMQRTAERFYQLAQFPRVIGAIDCTLIRLQSPGGEDAEIFRCRKGFFALNVQTVSDANLKIRNIVARWPGSAHDQTIFNNSRLKQDLEAGRYGRYILVGDSRYTVQPYLMTKLQVANNGIENMYNESIIRTRNVVERQYGVWKRRFPILSTGLRLKISTAMRVIVATAIIHNMAVDMNDLFPDEWFEDDIMDIEDIHNIGMEPGNGRQARQLIINNHFARL